jgi:hypothetical protein
MRRDASAEAMTVEHVNQAFRPIDQLTPSHPPPFRGRRRDGSAEALLSMPVLCDRHSLLPLPLKGGGREGVISFHRHKKGER